MGLTGGLVQRWQTAARALKRELYALYLASRDPRTPWYAKAAIAGVLAYALSPIDLIPDFIPVLGYLDDLVLLPAGIWMALRLIPPTVMAESRARAEEAVPAACEQGRSHRCLMLVGVLCAASAKALCFLARHYPRRRRMR